jgi:hypothetical protein
MTYLHPHPQRVNFTQSEIHPFSFHYIESESELLAYLHQIKLYFHYILADKFAEARVPTPAKLNARCVHLSFDEMRKDGFADDGLFDQMKMFFLPLTMVEQDLTVDESQWRLISQIHQRERAQLLMKKQRLIDELTEKDSEYYDHNDSIRKLRKNINFNRQMSTGENGEQYEGFSVPELLDEHRKAMDKLDPIRDNLRTQIQSIEDVLTNIEQALKKKDVNSSKKNDRDLIKPNRGFIMYGPPGEFL